MTSNTTHLCSACTETFSSRNKLFTYLRIKCRLLKAFKKAITAESYISAAWVIALDKQPAVILREIITSTAPLDIIKLSGYAFRDWKYTTFKLRLIKEAAELDAYGDTRYSVTLGDKKYMLRIILNTEIRKILAPVSIRGLGNKIVITNEYVTLTLYIDDMIDG